MKWGMNGHVYLERLSGKFGFGDIQNARSTLSFGQSNKIIKDVRWQAPPESFFKLNTDGSRLKNGPASAGGLVRDCSGKWQFGFGMNIGFGSVTTAELWGLFQGLNIAWDRGIRYLIAEGMALQITIILKGKKINWSLSSYLIRDAQPLQHPHAQSLAALEVPNSPSFHAPPEAGSYLKYDPHSNEVTIMYRGLAFPNGVALIEDKTFLLVAESTPMRVLRFWLHDHRAMCPPQPFAQLQKFQDNIEADSKGEFWVA
ncbi:hypothetical protein WN944_000325 [Citrus x changshan-huyou]|uniref:RNase H type-1 domain-containing protein n=1 Tax=Citrus x changshan-huyou TaxID=2935761 RepID=A0AAP0MHN3_9ROSI